MDRLLREGNPPTGQIASPKPQYKKKGSDPIEYEQVEGQHGAPFAALVDTDGNPITPASAADVALLKAELAAIKGMLTDGTAKGEVTLSGKKASVAHGDYGQTLSVAAGNSAVITIRPPVGELWRIRLLRVIIHALVGATTGTHRLDVCLYTAQESLMTLIEPYNKVLNITRNQMLSTTATTKEPADPATQVRIITSLVCTNSVPLVLYYHNYSDATQVDNPVIRVVREVEYINA